VSDLYGVDCSTDEIDNDASTNWRSGFSLCVLRCGSQVPKIPIPEQLERRDIENEEWRRDCVQEDV